MRKYNNQRFITQATVNDNIVVLTQDPNTGKYYSYWGLGEPKSKVELTICIIEVVIISSFS